MKFRESSCGAKSVEIECSKGESSLVIIYSEGDLDISFCEGKLQRDFHIGSKGGFELITKLLGLCDNK